MMQTCLFGAEFLSLLFSASANLIAWQDVCVFFFKCLDCHHGFNPSVMVVTLPLVAGIAIDFDDPSRCRKCKCHLPHELVAQKWCHFLVRRLRNSQVTIWVRIFLDANQSRRPRSKTLPWSTKRWDDVIFPIPESLSFNKLWLELVGSLHHSWWHVRLAIPKCFTVFFVTSKFHMNPNLRAETETWNQWFRCKRVAFGGRTWMVENIRDLAGEVFY